MKKVLLVLALGALMFSCAKDEVATSKNEEKSTRGIVDPNDPDMNNYPVGNPIANSPQNPDVYYHKTHLLINDTSDSIRVNIYALPKFSMSNNIFFSPYITEGFYKLEFLYKPNDSGYSWAHYQDYGNNLLPAEIFENLYAGPSLPVDDRYWNIYPSLGIGPSSDKFDYKIAFIEFWVKDGDYEGEHHWMALETKSSYYEKLKNVASQIYQGTPMPYGMFNFSPLPINFPLSDVMFFGIENELHGNSTGGIYTLYYFNGNVHNTAYDKQYNVQGTFRYMPNVVTPNYPHFNPDTTPGYIIKFENL